MSGFAGLPGLYERPAEKKDSISGLRLDIATAKIIVWVATRRDFELAPEAHMYFFDRYKRLAECHRQRGRIARAMQLQARADEHYLRGGGDGPPYAAAMGMPRPRRWLTTDAVSRNRLQEPNDAA